MRLEGGERIATVLSILLLILKIIGIALLVILGLVILILAVLLLVPIRYQIRARVHDGVKAKADVGWLLRMIHVEAGAIGGQILVKIKAFGHCFKKLHLGSWGEEEEENRTETEEEDRQQEKKPNKQEEKTGKSAEKAKGNEAEPSSKESEIKEKNAPEKKKKKLSAVIEEEYSKLFEEEEETAEREEIEESEASGTDIRELIDKVSLFLEDEKNQQTIELVKKQLKKLGRHLLPTKFRIDGELGLADPGQTGRIIGMFYRFYPLYGDHIRLRGVYDEQAVNVYAEIGGRIRLGIFAEIAVRLFLNKTFRGWIRQLSGGEEKDKDGKKREKETEKTGQAA